MEKIIEKLKTQIIDKHIVFWAIVSNLMVYVLYWAMYSVKLITSTDKVLDISYALGKEGSVITPLWMKTVPNFVMQTAYSVLPKLSWYVLFQQGCILVVLTVITYTILKKGVIWSNALIAVIFVFYVGFDGYIQMNYVKTAIICCAAAYFMMYKTIKGNSVYMLIFWLMGYFWSSEIAIIALVFMAISYKIKKVEWNKKTFMMIGMVLLVAIICEGIHIGGAKVDDDNELVEYYMVWAQLDAVGWPDYAQYENIYEDFGISEEDFELIISPYAVNEDLITLEEMKALTNLTEEVKLDKDGFLAFTRTYPARFVHFRVFYGFVLIMFLFAMSKAGNKRLKMAGTGIGIVLSLLLSFFFGVSANEGIARGILVCATTFLVSQVDEIERPKNEIAYYYIFTMIIYILFSMVNGA